MYRLPSGIETGSVEEYLSAWKELAAPIEKATGSRLAAFDPGFQFALGKLSWWLPVEVALAFKKALS